MSAHTTRRCVARRLEALELQSLRTLCEKQHEEIARLSEQLALAEQEAEFWREDALGLQAQLCELTKGAPGMTRDGRLVVVST